MSSRRRRQGLDASVLHLRDGPCPLLASAAARQCRPQVNRALDAHRLDAGLTNTNRFPVMMVKAAHVKRSTTPAQRMVSPQVRHAATVTLNLWRLQSNARRTNHRPSTTTQLSLGVNRDR